jgi:hypothetical protein
MQITSQKSESAESLIPNKGETSELEQSTETFPSKFTNEWVSFFSDRARQLAEGISKDMRDFDSAVNNLVFGEIEMDLSFLEKNISNSMEWNNFVSTKDLRLVPDSIKQSLLCKNEKLSTLYKTSVPKVIDEEGFWNRWQFFCFLRDQQNKKKSDVASREHSNESMNLINEKEILQLEEWD